MRELKFKARAVDDGNWYYGQLIRDVYSDKYWILERPYQTSSDDAGMCICSDGYFVEVVPETLCQYTGEKDGNKNEIYEYDIVKGNFPYAEYGVVIWDAQRCGFYILPVNKLFKSASDKYYKLNANRLEVIGNIFDNADLLLDFMIEETTNEQTKKILQELKEKGVGLDVKMLLDVIKRPFKRRQPEIKLTNLIPHCYSK